MSNHDKKSFSPALKDIGLFRGLSSKELKLLRSCIKEKIYEKGELLFYDSKPCERVFVIRSGRVKVFRTASSGREQILEVLEGGDTCACNPGATQWCCSSSAEALTTCQVWFLSREDYVRLVKVSSQLTHTLNRIFAERLSKFSSLIEKVSLDDTKKRLAKFLLDLHGNNVALRTQENLVSLPFTREEIAHRIGSSRETVARHLHEFKRKKLIEIKPKQIVILNKNGLEKHLS
ncbi:MAG: Crp/Fnr family transcriptional regulator [Candidatus Omnitrophota bacterium]